MFGSQIEPIIESFAAQFEGDGDRGYIYRHRGWGAGVGVSQAEYQGFVAEYRRQVRRWFVGLGVFTVAAILGFAAMQTMLRLASGTTQAALIATILIVSAVAVGGTMYAREAPRRALTDRKAVGAERSREEANAIAIARQSWVQIATYFVGTIIVFAVEAHKHDILHGWYRLWWLFLAFGAVCCGYAALRKWRNPLG